MPLFSGFQIKNNITMSKLNLAASTVDLEKARDDIRVAVAQAYVQILYDKEILAVARRQVEIDSLQVVRLDSRELAWIDVRQFVTVPYWTLELPEAVRYGFCIAVYNEQSRHQALDRKGHRGPLPDGTRVLMCDRRTSRYLTPDREKNPLLGITFRNRDKKESYFRTFLFFDPADLTPVY